MHFFEDFIPSNQTYLFAEETLQHIKELKSQTDMSVDEIIEIYKIGVMAQKNDFLYKIAESAITIAGSVDETCDHLRSYEIYGIVADALDNIANAIKESGSEK